VWHASEYEKLREFTTDGWRVPCLSPFLCHQTHALGRKTLCRGWLTVERDSPAVRVLLIQGRVTGEQVDAPCPIDLYATGEEAAAAGLEAVADPPPAARRMIGRLCKRLCLRRRRR
jgi:hypothetical protein